MLELTRGGLLQISNVTVETPVPSSAKGKDCVHLLLHLKSKGTATVYGLSYLIQVSGIFKTNDTVLRLFCGSGF